MCLITVACRVTCYLIPVKGKYKHVFANTSCPIYDLKIKKDLLETKNMIPAAKERLNFSKAEK